MLVTAFYADALSRIENLARARAVRRRARAAHRLTQRRNREVAYARPHGDSRARRDALRRPAPRRGGARRRAHGHGLQPRAHAAAVADVEQLTGDRETGDLECAARARVGRLPRRQRLSAAARASVGRAARRIASRATRSSRPRRSTSSRARRAHRGDRRAASRCRTHEVDAPRRRSSTARSRSHASRRWRRAFPGRALILRPGIVAGPYDPTNRFTWWVERVARGGEVLAPGTPDSPVQLVDGRDLGAFSLAQSERAATGIFNVCGPPSSFGELIAACKAGTGTRPDATWLGEELLLNKGVEPFTSCRSGFPTSRRTAPSTRSRTRVRGRRHSAATARRDGARHVGVAARRARRRPARADRRRLRGARARARARSGATRRKPICLGSCQASRLRAVASISIFMRGSARPHTCIVAAGSATPKARRRTGQQAGKSSASGSR